jgi:hypothetical protein
MGKRPGLAISIWVLRRVFPRFWSAGPLLLSTKGVGSVRVNLPPLSGPKAGSCTPQAEGAHYAIREFLNKFTCIRHEVEAFPDSQKPNWAKFDPELGYALRDNTRQDGVDGSRTVTS